MMHRSKIATDNPHGKRKIPLNSLTPEGFGFDYKNVIFSLALQTCIFRSYDNIIRWMPQDLTYCKSTLVQVMAWCHLATSHYLIQCWPRSLLPYGVTRPQWVKKFGMRFSVVQIFPPELPLYHIFCYLCIGMIFGGKHDDVVSTC